MPRLPPGSTPFPYTTLFRSALAAFHQPGRAVTVGAPQAAALPAGAGIIDPSVEALGVEAHRVGDAQQDHLAVLERDEAVLEGPDRKSTRLNSSHTVISYAVF